MQKQNTEGRICESGIREYGIREYANTEYVLNPSADWGLNRGESFGRVACRTEKPGTGVRAGIAGRIAEARLTMEETSMSRQIKTLLCPIDFSELSAQALAYAGRLAACWDARLVVVYADTFLPPPYFTADEAQELVLSLDRSKQAAGRQLKRFAEEHLGKRDKVETRIAELLPVPAIVGTAEQEGADLVVMGTHGRSGLSRLMLGSVAERVLREIHIPVLTVRQQSGGTAGAGGSGPREVLCPVNYTELSRTALEYAATLASCLGARVRVLHVLESGRPTDAAQEKERLCAWVPAELRDKCGIEEHLAHGDAAEQVLATATASGAELIVIGGQHQRFSDSTVIGTTTVRVTRHAPCPVLTVML